MTSARVIKLRDALATELPRQNKEADLATGLLKESDQISVENGELDLVENEGLGDIRLRRSVGVEGA